VVVVVVAVVVVVVVVVVAVAVVDIDTNSRLRTISGDKMINNSNNVAGKCETTRWMIHESTTTKRTTMRKSQQCLGSTTGASKLKKKKRECRIYKRPPISNLPTLVVTKTSVVLSGSLQTR
jgi:hypothetical protein